MKWATLFLFFALIGTATAGHDTSLPPLSQLLRLAYSGELEDAVTIHEMEKAFAGASPGREKTTYAFLLTLVPRRHLNEKDAAFYLEFVRNTPNAQEVLGPEAMDRTIRLSADELYERGQFVEAEKLYQKLLSTPSSKLRNYAALKLGWCAIHGKQTEAALALWVDTLRNEIQKPGAEISESLMHDIGVAFAESTTRTPKIIESLNALTLSESQQGLFEEGVLEGLRQITSVPDALERFAREARGLSGYAQLLTRILAHSAPTGERACRFLPFYEQATPALIELSALEACNVWIATQKGKAADIYKKQLSEVLAALPLEGERRSVRYNFYRTQGELGRACEEAAHIVVSATETVAIDLKEAGSICKKAPPSDLKPVLMLLTARKEALQDLKNGSPQLFLLNALLTTPPGQSSTLAIMKEDAARFQDTLIPEILAEHSLDSGDKVAAAFLFETYGSTQPGRPVWDRTLANELGKALDEKRYVDVGSQWARISPEARKSLTLSPKSQAAVFDALLSGQLSSLPKEGSEDLNLLGDLAHTVSTGDFEGFTKISLPKGHFFKSDQTLIQQRTQRSVSLLQRPKKGAWVKRFLEWNTFVQQGYSKIGKHTWIHPQSKALAVKQMSDFCTRAEQSLQQWTTDASAELSQIPGWSAIRDGLAGQLQNCVQSASEGA